MKRTLISLATAIGISMVPAAMLAQSAAAEYNIPFSFNAAGIELPAGRYTVSNTGVQFATLFGHGGGMNFILKPGKSDSATSHLTFYRYGNAYFLHQVTEANGTTASIKTSSAEKEIRSRWEQAQNKRAEVLLTATR
jgi:hypothetical protein